MAELHPVGSEFVADGMRLKCIGHGKDRYGRPCEIPKFLGLVEKASKGRKPQVSIGPQLKLSGAKSSPTVGPARAPKRKAARRPSYSYHRRGHRSSQPAPPPEPDASGVVWLIAIVAIIIAFIVVSDWTRRPTFNRPPQAVQHHSRR